MHVICILFGCDSCINCVGILVGFPRSLCMILFQIQSMSFTLSVVSYGLN